MSASLFQFLRTSVQSFRSSLNHAIGQSYGSHIRNRILDNDFDIIDTQYQTEHMLRKIGEPDLISKVAIEYSNK